MKKSYIFCILVFVTALFCLPSIVNAISSLGISVHDKDRYVYLHPGDEYELAFNIINQDKEEVDFEYSLGYGEFDTGEHYALSPEELLILDVEGEIDVNYMRKNFSLPNHTIVYPEPVLNEETGELENTNFLDWFKMVGDPKLTVKGEDLEQLRFNVKVPKDVVQDALYLPALSVLAKHSDDTPVTGAGAKVQVASSRLIHLFVLSDEVEVRESEAEAAELDEKSYSINYLFLIAVVILASVLLLVQKRRKK